ncbi:MAG: hypothetical protein ACR2O6_04865 [Ilumatobacteraceae bacterium]
MRITRHTGGLLLVGAMAVASACGSDEASLEELLEGQAGDDVELDLEGDGGFTIENEDGSITVDEEGNFILTDENGEVITGDVDPDDDSIVVQSEDGQVVIEGDGESGSIEITGEEGEGEVTFSGSDDIPDDWPTEVPVPTGLDIIASSTFADAETTGWTVIGMTETSPSDYLAAYGPMLESAGFSQTTIFESEGNLSAFYEGAVWVVTVAGSADPSGPNTITIGVNSNQ